MDYHIIKQIEEIFALVASKCLDQKLLVLREEEKRPRLTRTFAGLEYFISICLEIETVFNFLGWNIV